uniref:Uncharacterized protein n=1 Tax=Podoviridae sp. ctZih56 TaxID=2827741 RepID=A0A8S5SFC1_9CAUD|nr:MAG TPA: hypothetical protein [Podoviridae sp. ctZih56]
MFAVSGDISPKTFKKARAVALRLSAIYTSLVRFLLIRHFLYGKIEVPAGLSRDYRKGVRTLTTESSNVIDVVLAMVAFFLKGMPLTGAR